MKFRYLLILLFTASAPFDLARSQDGGPSIKIEEKARSGPWTISKVRSKGSPSYGMMSRSYQDGRLFRYFGGEAVSAIMVFDQDAMRAFPKGADSVKGTVSFAKPSGDTEPVKVTVSRANTLTSEQDAVLTVNVSKIPYFLVGIADSEAIVLSFNGYSGKFPLKGSTEAAKEMVKYSGTNL